MLKKNRSDTCRFKDEKHFFGSSLVKSNYKKKENNQRVMFKMSYSNSIRQHNKYIKYYMPQMQKDTVIDKPELFGTTDEEYKKNKVAGHFKFIVSPENQNVNLKVLINFSSEILLVPFKTEISFSCKLANSNVTSAGANA
jgi:hypothetical protein